MPAATAPVPASEAMRKPTPQLPWQRLIRRRPVAASTRSASTFMAILALVRPKPKSTSVANSVAVPTASADSNSPTAKSGNIASRILRVP